MKSHIVRQNETGMYFTVKYYLTTILGVALVKDKKLATIFQEEGDEILAPNGVDKFSINKIRSKEFRWFLCCKGTKTDDVTFIELDAPVQPHFIETHI